MALAVAGATSQAPDAYGYLCHLQEMKQWLETCLKTELPPVDELEERMRNGVYLVRLGMSLMPGDSLWTKAYDLDETKYSSRGLDFRHTDNINLWIQSLSRLGLPSVFYPGVTDVYEKKNMPRLVYCLHALSHFLKKEGRIGTSVRDLYGEAQFSEKEVKAAQSSLAKAKEPVPSFEVVEDLVEEEIQYQGMDVLAPAVKAERKRLDDAAAAAAAAAAEKGKVTSTKTSATITYEDMEMPKETETETTPREESYEDIEVKPKPTKDNDAYDDVEVTQPSAKISNEVLDYDEVTPDPLPKEVSKESEAYDDVAPDPLPKELSPPPPPLPVKQKRSTMSSPASTATSQAPALELIYDAADPAAKKLSQQEIYGELQCNKQGWTAVLYARVNKDQVKKKREELAKAGLSQLEAAVQAINKAVSGTDPQTTYAALKADDAQLPQIFNEPEQYHKALVAARKLALPNSALVVYTGISREETERLLSSMSAGAYLVRRSGSSPSDHIVSFRNQTGIKHWKIGFEGGQYFWGNSGRYETLAEFVEAFTFALQVNTKLMIYPGVSKELTASSNMPPDVQQMLQRLQKESESSLTHEQIRQVVLDMNEKIKAQLKAIMSGGDEPAKNKPPPPAGGLSKTRPSTMKRSVSGWKKTMVLAVNRQQAEQLLSQAGRPGSYLVRPSESEIGSFSISYRTTTELKHWKAMKNKGSETFVIPPKTDVFNSLEDVVQFFENIVRSTTGLVLEPLNPIARSASKRQHQPLPPVPQPQGGKQVLDEVAPEAPRRTTSVGGRPSQGGRSVSHWSVDDVMSWMQRVGLGDYAAVFKANEVDGACLEQITNDMLKNDLNVAALGNRQRILRKVQLLVGNVK